MRQYNRKDRGACIRLGEENLLQEIPLLKGFFSLFPKQVVFVENEQNQVIGVITRALFRQILSEQKPVLLREFRWVSLGSEAEEEAEGFFTETNYSWLPLLDENRRLVACYFRKYFFQEEEAISDDKRWLNITTDDFARLLQMKGCRKIKVLALDDTGERVWRYLRHYRAYFDKVEKISWRSLTETEKGETILVTQRSYDMDGVIKGEVIASRSLQMELEYRLLLRTCKQKKVKLYLVNLPSEKNIWNVTNTEAARMLRGCPLRDYLRNREAYGELLEEVLSDLEDIDEFLDFCINADRLSICDRRGKYVNVVNGERITTGVPKVVKNYVYLAGHSFVYGVIVDDRHTLASLLQERLNLLPEFQNYAVVNQGVGGLPLEGSIKKLNRENLQCGDIVVLFFEPRQYNSNGEDAVFSHRKLWHMEDAFNRLDRRGTKSYFIESPLHPNAFGYGVAADYLVEMLRGQYEDGGELDGEMLSEEYSGEEEPGEDFQAYLRSLKPLRREGRTGAIVMNCNPLTYGHKFLIDYARHRVEQLFIFVVQEDKSAFSFEERFEMVKACTEGYSNVTVLPSGQYVISGYTFADYFSRKKEQNTGGGIDCEAAVDAFLDVELFGKYIAPALNISVRFVGDEPRDYVTAQYNQAMKRLFPQYGLELVEIPRHTIRLQGEEEAISASSVREAVTEGEWERVRGLVPETTWSILEKKYFEEGQEEAKL